MRTSRRVPPIIIISHYAVSRHRACVLCVLGAGAGTLRQVWRQGLGGVRTHGSAAACVSPALPGVPPRRAARASALGGMPWQACGQRWRPAVARLALHPHGRPRGPPLHVTPTQGPHLRGPQEHAGAGEARRSMDPSINCQTRAGGRGRPVAPSRHVTPTQFPNLGPQEPEPIHQLFTMNRSINHEPVQQLLTPDYNPTLEPRA